MDGFHLIPNYAGILFSIFRCLLNKLAGIQCDEYAIKWSTAAAGLKFV